MSLKWLPHVARASALAVLVTTALGCTIHLVSNYDDQIDSGLSSLNTDMTAFVNKMIDAAGTPAGQYDANRDFYTNEDAKIATLIVRAEAHKALNSCPTASVVAAAVKAAFPPPATTASAGPIPMPDVSTVLAQVRNDDCSVVLLGLVRQGLGQMEAFHKAQQAKGIPAAAHDPLLVGGLGSLIRAAIIVETAKKTGGSTIGGLNGA